MGGMGGMFDMVGFLSFYGSGVSGARMRAWYA